MATDRTNQLKTVPTTVLFADIVGSIDLFARLGNQAAKDLIDAFFRELGFLVLDHGGVVVKSVGDEIMCSFAAPLSAFNAARDMQRVTEAQNITRSQKISLRIGFHSGNVIAASRDLFGDTVNIASRVTTAASMGRILTTGDSMSLVPAHEAGLVRPWRRELLKGVAEPIDLFEVLWADDSSNLGAMTTTSVGNYQAPTLHQMVIKFQNKAYLIDAQRPLLTVGRNPSNNVVVVDPNAFVSSHHAKIELRGGVFVITDMSLNGTYISLGEKEYFRIKLPYSLDRAGQFTLGYPPGHPGEITGTFDVA